MNAVAQVYSVGIRCPLGKSLADGASVTLSCVMPFEDVRNFERRLQRLFAGAVDDMIATLTITSGPVAIRIVVPRWQAKHKIGQRWMQNSSTYSR
ncbi:hypothetical protein ACQZ6B_09110 [Agrobacterium vitis]